MRSIDTNVVMRFFLEDNERQLAAALQILGEPTLLLATVVIEAFWVLDRGLGWLPGQIAIAFDTLLRLADLSCPDEPAIRRALERYVAGADFPDMLHLALSHQASSFVTFDQRIARFADASVVPVETVAA